MKAVVLFSGGLDSTTLLYHSVQEYAYGEPSEVIALSFDYGQRHAKELAVAAAIAADLEVVHHIVKLGAGKTNAQGEVAFGPLANLLPGSSLTDPTVPVPNGHYGAENMKATVVPNRNAIMLSIAYGVGVAYGAEVVVFGAHAGDHAIYPDCRPVFVSRLERALMTGNRWDKDTPVPELFGPFLDMSKADIAEQAVELDVPIEKTWSCYQGGELHCGRCGTCVERLEALDSIPGFIDPTAYEDRDYWKTVVR
jgi:7-cyano-7-deazaguanine synthase